MNLDKQFWNPERAGFVDPVKKAERKSTKKRKPKMVKKKRYYAVREGREVGIFRSWSRVKPLVGNYPGSCFKGFRSLEEATTFLEDDDFCWSNYQKRKYGKDLQRSARGIITKRTAGLNEPLYSGEAPPWD